MRRTRPKFPRQNLTFEELTGLKSKQANFVIEYVKDFAARRAAEASGYDPDYGHTLLKKEPVQEAIQQILARRLETSEIDAEWVLAEAADNHLIARQAGNLSASNAALKLIAQHTAVDAMATKKHEVDVTSNKDIADRLSRWRQRVNKPDATPDDEVSFI